MGRSMVFVVVRSLLIFLASLTFPIEIVWATSGIVLLDGPTQVTSGNPPCNAERITTFEVRITNVNGPLLFCSEDANPIRQLGLPDVFTTEENPRGSFEFLGFKTSEDGELSSRLEFLGLGAGEVKTFFFDVKTGPAEVPLLGKCDFEEVEFGITICDTGGGCDFFIWTDPPDPVCESPKHMPVIKLQADTSFCPASDTGTGRIEGTVSDGEGRPVGGARVEATRGCRGSPGFVNQEATTDRLPPNRGRYELTNLPFPATYMVEVWADGLCTTAEITIPGSGETIIQNFTLIDPCS